jgi:hypothetical protein
MSRKRPETCTPRSKNQWKPHQMSSTRNLCTSGMLQKNWPECWKSCATHENGPKRTFSRKRTCKPFWPEDIPLVLLCIKLWSIRGGGTVRVTKCIIPASVWASNSRFHRHLNRPKKARNVYPEVQKSMKTSPNVLYKESMHIGMLQKKWPKRWKSCATHENSPKRTFSRKRTSKPFWPGDIPLVLLCIKVWSRRGGGIVRVSKCIILTSVWASNSQFERHLNRPKKFERHLNRPKKARNMYPTVQK